MSFYLELHRASNITRDDNGVPISWRSGPIIKKFTAAADFLEYVQENASNLKNVVAMSGSASLLTSANTIIADKVRRAK